MAHGCHRVYSLEGPRRPTASDRVTGTFVIARRVRLITNFQQTDILYTCFVKQNLSYF